MRAASKGYAVGVVVRAWSTIVMSRSPRRTSVVDVAARRRSGVPALLDGEMPMIPITREASRAV
jgi:hypothetical protein